MVTEIKLLQSQIDSLDLRFLEHIPLAHGLFQMHTIDNKLPFEIDSDNDDSTADMTDDSFSTDESTDQNISHSEAHPEIAASHEAPRLVKERLSPRPNLLACLPGPLSQRTFDIEETERMKLQIKSIARQFKVRQQNIRNERAKRQFERSHQQGEALDCEIEWWSEEEEEEEGSVYLEMESGDCQTELLDIINQDKSDEIEQHAYLSEIETIRAQLDANEIRIGKLRDERNKDAALSLDFELMIARLDIVSPEVEQFILSVAELKTERKQLRDSLRSAGIDDAAVDATVQRQVKERELESTRIMQELSLRVQELQNDKNELSEQSRLLRIKMGNLEASSHKLDARIEVLQSACRSLMEGKSDGFEKQAGVSVVSPPSKRRGMGISGIFRRRR